MVERLLKSELERWEKMLENENISYLSRNDLTLANLQNLTSRSQTFQDFCRYSAPRLLTNYENRYEYLKTVPAKAFSPVPKVKSCLIWLIKKDKLPNIEFDELIRFLDLFSPYSRKTLGKISKMISKKWGSFVIPENLSNKRLEELDWVQLEEIFIA